MASRAEGSIDQMCSEERDRKKEEEERGGGRGVGEGEREELDCFRVEEA